MQRFTQLPSTPFEASVTDEGEGSPPGDGRFTSIFQGAGDFARSGVGTILPESGAGSCDRGDGISELGAGTGMLLLEALEESSALTPILSCGARTDAAQSNCNLHKRTPQQRLRMVSASTTLYFLHIVIYVTRLFADGWLYFTDDPRFLLRVSLN